MWAKIAHEVTVWVSLEAEVDVESWAQGVYVENMTQGAAVRGQ